MTDTPLAPFLASAGQDLVELSVPARCVPADLPCDEADLVLRQAPALTSLVVLDDDGRVGLLSRAACTEVMFGPLGYGRLLHARRPVGDIADWSPLVIDAAADVTDAAARLLLHHQGRWDDVLVREGEGIRVATAADVLTGLAGALAVLTARDELTGLADRTLFHSRLRADCERVCLGPTRDSVAVLHLDLDREARDDELERDAGDCALLAAAARLAATTRSGDLVARLGGGEFAVLVRLPAGGAPDLDPESRAAATAVGVAERYRCALTGGPSPLRVSIGVAVSRPGLADPETLLREADLALYRARTTGGQPVVVTAAVGHDLHALPLVRATTRPDRPRACTPTELTRALRAGELRLHYQPIVSLSQGAVASLEALLRWQHPTRGLLAPGQFLPDAEQLGVMADIDAWVLDQALADLARWRRELPSAVAPQSVNVNLSRDSLALPDLQPRIRAALARHDHPGSRLRLEIVESADGELLADAAPQLRALRADGVALAWDDMGAGATSLRQVAQLDVDGLKIDGGFVAAMLDNPNALSVVQMLIQLGTSLGLRVATEGVESREQLAVVTALGAGYAQGYHLSRPAPASDVPGLLQGWTWRPRDAGSRPPEVERAGRPTNALPGEPGRSTAGPPLEAPQGGGSAAPGRRIRWSRPVTPDRPGRV